MKEFFKKYLYDCVKLVVDQIALALFGVAMAVATGMAANNISSFIWVKWVSGVACVAFYLFIIYTMVWPIGAKDRISADYNRIPRRPWLGLCIGATASIPNVLLFLLIIIGEFVPALAGTKLVALLFEGMYMGLMTINVGGVPLNATWWAYGVIILPMIATATLAYFAGFNNFRVVPYKHKTK